MENFYEDIFEKVQLPPPPSLLPQQQYNKTQTKNSVGMRGGGVYLIEVDKILYA